MKWLIGFLLCLNLFVFALAYFARQETAGYATSSDLSDDVLSINLLSPESSTLAGNCTNLGPIEQEIVLDRFVKILDKQGTPFQVVSEPSRMIAAYRVVISAADSSKMNALKEQLSAVGIDEVYEKKSQSGDAYLSLGVFTYEKTALDFAANLTDSGFAANYKSELLEYPPRYWLNLKQALDQKIVRSLNDYIGSNTLVQTTAQCI